MFAITHFPLFPRAWGFFHEVQACAIRVVATCHKIGVVLLGDDTYYYSKSGIGHRCDTNHIVIVHESGALPFVFMICYGCCWIAMHCLWVLGSWVGVHIWDYIKMWTGDHECCNWRKPRKCLRLLQLELDVFDCKHLFLWKIDAYFHWLCVGYYRSVQHTLLLLITYTTFDVIKAKP